MEEDRVHREPREELDVLDDRAAALRDPARDRSEYNRDCDADEVVGGEKSRDPVALRVPPDAVLLEFVRVVRVEYEPVEVPGRAPGKVHRPGLKLPLDRPRDTHEEVSVEDERREKEHEAVVPRKGFSTHQSSVQLGDEARSPVPRRHPIGPSMLAFGLDFDASDQRSEGAPEQGLDDHGHPTSSSETFLVTPCQTRHSDRVS